ncbi:hypothetical protein GCM10022267_39790 [Lentzea roselyniae]|uniref:Uncharacterized protein n=1 Tax=Lentzea roselyniae TaxID=531940 RepID=A0ABP7B4R2_9PSEU
MGSVHDVGGAAAPAVPDGDQGVHRGRTCSLAAIYASRLDVRACWATTPDPADWERKLRQLSPRLTGLVPVINCGAGWSKGADFNRARDWIATALKQDHPQASA